MPSKLTFLFLFVASAACGQSTDSLITIGKKDRFFSHALNESREIWVSVPSSFREDMPYNRFPVVVVLDGPDHFFSTVGMIDRFSTNIGNEQCPPMIVVGLTNTDRMRDFYPPKQNDSFAVFLRNELLPYIDKKYPTEPYRVLIGHSLGGLRVVHTALYQRDLFNAYIAIDPSVGHDRNAWYERARKDIEKFSLGKSRMFIGMGQTMPHNRVQDTAAIRYDTSGYSNHMRRIMEFSETMMSRNSTSDPSFSWKFYPSESHQSLTQRVTYEGIEFLFNWYRMTMLGELFDPATSPERAVQLLKNYYSMISQRLGYTVTPPENSTGIWYVYEYKKQKEKGRALAEYNLQCHPDSKDAKDWVARIRKDLAR